MQIMSLPISEIGRETLEYQDRLAKEYGYRVLENDIALDSMRRYVKTLPDGFHLKNDSIPVINNPEIEYAWNKPGFIINKESFLLVSRQGIIIASGFNRIVVGHYGAFIEIENSALYDDNLKVKSGQEYRMKEPYKDKVKYLWFTTKDQSGCKIYKQKRQVNYADYREGYTYISPFEVLSKKELIDFLTKFEDDEEEE